jgi:hypothetical protein
MVKKMWIIICDDEKFSFTWIIVLRGHNVKSGINVCQTTIFKGGIK